MKKSILLSFLFILRFSSLSFAVMANPNLIETEQPDGTKINIKLKGDEFYNWFEDGDGYTVVKDSETKFWSYAKKNSFGDLGSSENIVGKSNPLNLNIKKSLKDDNRIFKAKLRRSRFNDKKQSYFLSGSANSHLTKASEDIQFVPAIGTKTNFVLLVQFKDLKFRDNPPFKNSSDTDIIKGFNELFNKTNYTKDGAVGSVKDYFNEISYGKLNYKSVISPIVTIDESYKEYSWKQGEEVALAKVQKMVRYALKKLDEQGYDFKSLWPNSDTPEGFSVVHAGGGAESGNRNFIWSHKSTIEPITLDGITFYDYHTEPAGRGRNGNEGLVRIGVICHESLHFFGLPGLYDTTYFTSGLGKFCIMSSGEWNGDNGNRPAHPCAWSKYKLGLITCQNAVEGINSIGESASDPEAFYIFKPLSFDSKEYFYQTE